MDDEYDWQDSWALTTGTKEQRDFYLQIFDKFKKLKDKNMPIIVEEDTYFSAEDARRVSDEQRRSIDHAELDKVYKYINEARWKGNNKVTIRDFNLRNSTKKFLEDKGFKVDHLTGSQWDPCNDTIISW